MTKGNMVKGKGFEYAVLEALKALLGRNGAKAEVEVDVSEAYLTAKRCFDELNRDAQLDYMAAALAGVKVIQPLEPHLTVGEEGDPVVLRIQGDARGQQGDVRDVVCIRPSEGWELGISCKHNHEALKHPRITKDADFGANWIGVPVSRKFSEEIYRVLDVVEDWLGTKWSEHPDKLDAVYRPALEAYVSEIARLCHIDESAPPKLVKYFFGSDDFYKLIAKDIRGKGIAGRTKVMAFNMYGTLGRPAKGRRPFHPVRQIKMPTRLIEIRVKPRSKTTLLMTFDEGWSISMRLHSADSKVMRTGLKWDVQLLGMPNGLYEQEQPWLPPNGLVDAGAIQ